MISLLSYFFNSFILVSFIFYLLIFHSVGMAQEIPNEFYHFKFQKLLHDTGQGWKTHTTFGPLRYNNSSILRNSHDSLLVRSRFGIYSRNENIALYGFGHFSFKKHLFLFRPGKEFFNN